MRTAATWAARVCWIWLPSEVTDRTIDFIDRAHREGKPFFVWWNSTHMHFRTHVRKEAEGKSGQGFYNDAMVDHDDQVGRLLAKLDELGIADDTIVVYSTDNGPHFNTWPDAAITPFRSEKDTNWEGAFRVPCFARWPGKFPAGKILNGIVSHVDWLPTLLSAAGVPDIVERMETGADVGDKYFHVKLDGYDMLPYFKGETETSPREEFIYISDDGELMAVRFNDWKLVFLEQRARTPELWAEPFVPLRPPKVFNLRRDPFERADNNSNTYWDWVIDHAFLIVPAQTYVSKVAASLSQFPPRQKPASFNLDSVLATLEEGPSAR